MPFVTPEITCNLQWRNTTRQLVFAKQGEFNSRKVLVQLYDGSNRFTFTSGTYTGEFAYRRPDGQGRAYSTIEGVGAVSLNGDAGTATITLEPEVLAVAGIVECELRLKTQNSLLATFTFGYFVEQAVVDSSTPSPSPGPDPTPVPTTSQTKFFGFETMTAYNQFVAQNPGVLVDGDIVVIKSTSGSDTVHTFYVLASGSLTSRHVITVPQGGSSGASTLSALGGGYGVCSSLKATVAKIVRIDGFVRTQNAPFQVKFNYDVQGGDTLNVRSSSSTSSGTGACTLRWNGANVPAGLITAGSTATLVYDGTYYQVLDVSPATAPMIADGAVTTDKIADGAITAAKVAAGVIPGWYYYASTSAYNNDAANVPNGSYVLIGTNQITLYRKASGSLSQMCAWPTGGGSGGTINLANNGIGYAVSPLQLDTAARTATMEGFLLRVNGLVAVEFGSVVEGPNPTLNINSTQAVPMYYHGEPLAGGKILSGDTALFIFDGNYYHLLAIDRAESGGSAENAVLYVSQSLTTAQKTQARTNIGAGTYSKPSNGIPKTDFASAVQTSLNKADSAYQKPMTGISEADLASDSVVISPDTEHAGQYVSTRTYAQIAQASSDGFDIKPEFWPDDNTTIRGAVLDISSTASVFAFLDMRSTPTVYVFTVNAQGVSVDSFAAGGSGGSGAGKLTVTISYSGGGYVSDKSPAEILAAKQAGDVIEVVCNGVTGWLSFVDANGATALDVAVDSKNYLEQWDIAANKSVTMTSFDLGDAYKPVTETLNGATPTISYAYDNRTYEGGTLTSLTVNNFVTNGIFELIFDSGATPTNLGLPEYDDQHPTAVYVERGGFVIEANKHYEISIRVKNGVGYLVGKGF